ncbi:site-specific integrase [Parendozoicomonas haliclonae]|uniref:Site-specific tyrosine recombinase XerC n=1 Tax=Parendozoicomonas haliclonae TaxID=1960125 RepID=A0A1X7AGM9_9GAMM|nr:site-specific integrase [Parendozoicomonas haliclonae]SMA40073.1 site-specific tyrosine recombinase XerC [Parendozoicomonas haliclonae]
MTEKNEKQQDSSIELGLIAYGDMVFDYGDPAKDLDAVTQAIELGLIQKPRFTESPTKPTRKSYKFGDLIDSFIDEYKQDRPKVADTTFKQYRGYLTVACALLENPLLSEIDQITIKQMKELLIFAPANAKQRFKNDWVAYRAAAVSKQHKHTLSHESVKNHQQWVKNYLKFCFENGHTESDLSEYVKVLKVSKDNKTKRIPFTADDLKKIFSGHLYNGSEPVYPARYWLPVLALYTGARIEEICQLNVSDIKKSDGGNWYIDINDEEAGKKLKTENAVRHVPIHPQLERAGFLEFVKSVQTENLFVEGLSNRAKKSSNLSQWFNRDEPRCKGYFVRCGITKNGSRGNREWTKVFHSFRHTFITACRDSGLQDSYIAAIVGHEQAYAITHGYGDKYSTDLLATEMDKVILPEFPLPTSLIPYGAFS